MNPIRTGAFLILFILSSLPASASPPWGTAKLNDIVYKPQKVVYDVSVNSLAALEHVLDRASYLSKLTGADPFDSSIVLVLHGPEIDYFAIANYEKYRELMVRAKSLSEGDIIKFRMCRLAAEGRGFKPEDIHGFVEMVPMGDAEIVRLQNEEHHAYMR